MSNIPAADPIDHLDLPIKIFFVVANSNATQSLSREIRRVSHLYRDCYDATNSRMNLDLSSPESKPSHGPLSSFLVRSGVRPAVLGYPCTCEVDTRSKADRKRKWRSDSALSPEEKRVMQKEKRKRKSGQLKDNRLIQQSLMERNKNVTFIKMNFGSLISELPGAIASLHTMKNSFAKLTTLEIRGSIKGICKAIEMSKAIAALSTLKILKVYVKWQDTVAWRDALDISYSYDTVLDTLLHPDALPCLESLTLRTSSMNTARALRVRGLRAGEAAGKLKELDIVVTEHEQQWMSEAIQGFVALEKLSLSRYIEIPQTLVKLTHVSMYCYNYSFYNLTPTEAQDRFVASIASKTKGLLSLKAFDLCSTSNYDGWDLRNLIELELTRGSLTTILTRTSSLTKLTLTGPMEEADAAANVELPSSIRSLTLKRLSHTSAAFKSSVPVLANVRELAIDNVNDETLAILRTAMEDNTTISALRLSGRAVPDRLLGFLASLKAPPETMRILELEGECSELAEIIMRRMSKLETLRLMGGGVEEADGRFNGENLAALFGKGAPSTLRRLHLGPCTWVRCKKGMQALASALKNMRNLDELRV